MLRSRVLAYYFFYFCKIRKKKNTKQISEQFSVIPKSYLDNLMVVICWDSGSYNKFLLYKNIGIKSVV